MKRLFAVAGVALFSCTTPDGAPPRESSCRRAHEHMEDLAAKQMNGDGAALLHSSFTAQRRTYVRKCTKRMTAKQVECVRAATTIEAVEACEPEVDRRMPHQRPSASECAKLAAHYAALLRKEASSETLDRTESLRAKLVERTRRTCATTMVHAEVTCQLAATDARALGRCEESAD